MNEYILALKKVRKLAKKLKLNIALSERGVKYKPPSKFSRDRGVAGILLIPPPTIRLIADDYNQAMRNIIVDILHEFGHFIVCAPSRRKKKNFGIPELSNNEYWELEEQKAVLVERKLCELLNIKPRGTNPLTKLLKFSFQRPYQVRNNLRKWWKEIGEQQTIKAFKEGII